MGGEPIVVDSARKHNIDDEDILHALRNYVHALAADDEGMTMVVGPARDTKLLEVGLVESVEGDIVVVHAMRARRKYLR